MSNNPTTNPWNKTSQQQPGRGSTSNRGFNKGGTGRGIPSPQTTIGRGRGRGEFKPSRQPDQSTPDVTPTNTPTQVQNPPVQQLHPNQPQNTTIKQTPIPNGNAQPYNPINRGGGKVPAVKSLDAVPQINRTSSAPPNIGELEAHERKLFIPEKQGFVNPGLNQGPYPQGGAPQKNQSTTTTSGQPGSSSQNTTTLATATTTNNTQQSSSQPGGSSTTQHSQQQQPSGGVQPQVHMKPHMQPNPYYNPYAAYGAPPPQYHNPYHHPYSQPFYPQQQQQQPTSTPRITKRTSTAIRIEDPTGKPVSIQQLVQAEKEVKEEEAKKVEEAKSKPTVVDQKSDQKDEVKKDDVKIEEPKKEVKIEEPKKEDEIKKEEPSKVDSEPKKVDVEPKKVDDAPKKVDASTEPKKVDAAEPKKESLAPLEIKRQEVEPNDDDADEEEYDDEEDYNDEEYDDEEEYDEEDEKEEEEEVKPLGKRMYSKEELLRFQHTAPREPPASLKNSEIYQTQVALSATPSPRMQRVGSSNNFSPYPRANSPRTPGSTPKSHGRQASKHDLSQAPVPGGFKSYMESNKKPKGGRGRGGEKSGRKSAGRGRGGPVEELQIGANAWQAGKSKSDEEKIYKEVKGVLNRLTREKYDALKKEFLAIRIPSEIILKNVIDEVFEKAVMEPTFSDLYADLCKDLSKEIAVANPDQQGGGETIVKPETFKRILLNKCQSEFEKEEKQNISEDKFAEMSAEEREFEELKLRRRMIGNIIFIGELFKQSMLSEKIMHEVIKRLLMAESPSEHDIEVFCKLITTIGKKLDHEKAAKLMTVYFLRMEQLAKEKSYTSRIRFMLQDAIELRDSAWEPRIKVTKAKKISEIREEDKKEKQKQERELAQKKKYNDNRDRYADDRGNQQGGGRGRGRGGGNMPRNSSDSRLDSRGNNRNRESRYSTIMNSPAKETRLGPVSSYKDARNTATPNKKRTTGGDIVASNAFSALEGSDDDQASDLSDEDRDNVDEADDDEEEEDEVANQGLEDDSARVIKDYLEEGDTDEAVKDYNKLGIDTRQAARFIKKSVEIAFEKKEEQQDEISKLLKTLKKEVDTVTEQSFELGFDICLQNILSTELYIDIPHAFGIYAALLGRALFDELISFDAVYDILRKHIKGNKDALLTGNQAIEILVGMGKKLVYELEISDDSERKEFLLRLNQSSFNVLHVFDLSHSKQLQKYAEESRKNKTDDLDVVTKIFDIVVRKEDATNGIKFLNDTFGDKVNVTISSKVVCSVICGIESSNPSESEEESAFNKYESLLTNVLKDSEAQLNALFEIQYYYHQQDERKQDNIARLFKLFKQKGWISGNTFDEWKNDTKNKTPGKQAALSKVSGIF